MTLYVDIEKRLGKFHLKVKLEAQNNVVALLGASGCGKSMTLKCIAGIERPDRGRIVLDGVTFFDSDQGINLPPQKRRVGYLFQQYALFPNMTVEQNIDCGVRDRSQKDEKVREMLEIMGLKGMEKKRPHQLSGGQQQRVALARILVNEPEVLLLDEPFSALDTHLRFHLERQVQEILQSFRKPVLLVSHNRDEAFRLADDIAIMAEGQIEDFGEKRALFRAPRTRNGAVLTGCKNISAAKWVDETHVYAVDWDITVEVPYMEVLPEYIGIRMHDIKVVSKEDCAEQQDAWKVLRETEKSEITITEQNQEPDSGQNVVTCRVIGEIEEPFSYTVQLMPIGKKAVGFLGVSLEKAKWESMRRPELTVDLPKETLLLLKEQAEG